jgi:hypothetical protein
MNLQNRRSAAKVVVPGKVLNGTSQMATSSNPLQLWMEQPRIRQGRLGLVSSSLAHGTYYFTLQSRTTGRWPSTYTPVLSHVEPQSSFPSERAASF